MRKLPSRKLLATLVAGALFLPHTGFTLGLGEIEVNSALNQKLKADIELLSATPEDTENLIIKLASRKEFSRAGLDRPYALSDLRFKSEVVDGVPHIKVSSGSPIREPYLNFLIEIDWPNGHLLREYTVLLDPPVFMTKAASSVDNSESRPASNTESRPVASAPTPATVAAPIPVVTGSSRPAASQPSVSGSQVSDSTSTAPAFMPAPVVQQQTPINQPPGSYRIKSGDTAWSLADAMRPDQSVTVPQMMFAILRANPEAFNQENINGLKRGYILRMPDAAQIAAISKADSQAMMREHKALWRQYQQSQAGGQPVSAMESDGSAVTGGTGGGDTSAENAHLAIVSAGSGTSTAGSKDPSEMTAQELRAELALARERVETERVEKEVLQARINTLEQYAEQREGLLSVEDEELSGVQALNAPASEAVEGEAANAESMESQLEGEAGELDVQDMAGQDLEGQDTEAQEQEGLTEQATGEDATDAVFTDEVTEPVAEEAAGMQQDIVASDITATPQDSEQAAPTDPLTQLLNNPMLLAAAGGGLLLIAGLIALMIKRRKAGSEDDDSAAASGFADIEGLADDIAEETAGDEVKVDSLAGDQVLDTEEESVSESGSTEAPAESTAETVVTTEDEARDDVIAEAEVYLAYGIYQQAEDLLNQALLENPERNDYRVKLAETHYASKNAEAFTEIATEIKTRIDNDESPEWQKVLTMGQDLCTDNPMFEGAAVADLDLGDASPDEPSMDFDLSDSAEDTANDLDLNMDGELELPEMDDAEKDVTAGPAEEIEFDISDTGAIEETEATEDEFSLDIDATELDIEDEATGTAESDEESIDLTDIDIGLDEDKVADSADVVHDLEDTDIEFGLDEGATVSEAAEGTEEEEEITLDLSEEAELMDIGRVDDETEVKAEVEAEATAATVVAAANDDSVDADEGDFDLSSLDDIDEISTKLDLARAYLDMGDQDGTRDILEEVLADGNDEQKQEANELMEKLA